MNIADLKEVQPLAEAFELDPDKHYLVVLPTVVASEDAKPFADGLRARGFNNVAVIVGQIEVYDLATIHDAAAGVIGDAVPDEIKYV